jgi:hypothetical protein
MWTIKWYSFFLCMSVFLAVMPFAAQSQIYFDTHMDSRLWLEGSSTVHRFDCVARSIQGTAFLNTIEQLQSSADNPEPDQPPDGAVEQENTPLLHVQLEIPIRSFDCGHSRMNRDMYNALRSDTHEHIYFTFENATALEKGAAVADTLFQNGYSPFRVDGTLNVAGVDRDVSLVIQGREEKEGKYRIRGQKGISMHDFDIEPPTALRGLIRANDHLTVFF